MKKELEAMVPALADMDKKQVISDLDIMLDNYVEGRTDIPQDVRDTFFRISTVKKVINAICPD